MSANQGKVLKGLIDTINKIIGVTSFDNKRYISSVAGINITNEKHDTWLPIQASDFIAGDNTTTLNGLATKVADKDGQTITTSSYIDYAIRVKNGIKMLSIPNYMFKKNISSSTWIQILTLSSDFRPIDNIYVPCVLGGSQFGSIRIQTDGKVFIFSTVALTTDWRCFFYCTFL